MDIKKLAPWNWFKREEEESEANVPVQRTGGQITSPEDKSLHPILQLHHEMDRLFANTFRGVGLSPFNTDFFTPLTSAGFLKPQVDIAATDNEYTITVEVPGVSEKDVSIEIADNNMIIRGEKKQEKEEKDKNYYRIERSYGSFQRLLSMPEDADQDNIKAKFKSGVLTIKMPRKDMPKTNVKRVEIK